MSYIPCVLRYTSYTSNIIRIISQRGRGRHTVLKLKEAVRKPSEERIATSLDPRKLKSPRRDVPPSIFVSGSLSFSVRRKHYRIARTAIDLHRAEELYRLRSCLQSQINPIRSILDRKRKERRNSTGTKAESRSVTLTCVRKKYNVERRKSTRKVLFSPPEVVEISDRRSVKRWKNEAAPTWIFSSVFVYHTSHSWFPLVGVYRMFPEQSRVSFESRGFFRQFRIHFPSSEIRWGTTDVPTFSQFFKIDSE